jgi:uncharacterized protein (DUF1501 family)
MRIARREFLLGCTSAVAALAGSRLRYLALADAATPAENRETLVVVFLRGGMDGLSLVPPLAGSDRGYYEEARPILKVPLTGEAAALPLDDQFGLHPAAASLRPFFEARKLAIIHAVGSGGTRSHFDAQKYLELGTPGVKTTPAGWLTRHLQSSPTIAGTVILPALAAGSTPPTSLQGNHEFINLPSTSAFDLGYIGHISWASGEQWATLRRMYHAGDTVVHTAGIQALNAAGFIESYVRSDYQPSGGAKYPETAFGSHLKLIAQLMRSEVGLRAATVDLLGWDTHENQGVVPGGQFTNLVRQLADGLSALYIDLDDSSADAPIQRITVVVLSEFGRRIRENANRGTDHGTANPVLVLGGNVRGGFHGTWPGLHPDQRFDNADLAPTTDFRQVLSEILIRRTANPRLGEVFPKYQGYAPLDIVTGTDLQPDYSVTLPVTPADFAAVRTSPTSVRLTWTPAAHATNYRIERRDSGGTWEHLVLLDGGAGHHDDTSLSAGLEVTYRVQALNSHGSGEFVETTVATVTDPRAQWRLTYFGTSANSGEAADDHIGFPEDGLTNFAKYALGLDPRVPARELTSEFVPGRPRVEVGTNTISLVYVKPAERSDVQYEVQSSSDLKAWSVVADDLEGTGDGWERRKATLLSPDPGAQFLKLSVRPR